MTALRRMSPHVLLIPIIGAWWLAEWLQRGEPLSLQFAILDEIAHLAVGLACAVWFVPAWGIQVLLWTGVAAVGIDVDHAVAAHSVAPEALMSVGARPPTHSLIAAGLFSVLTGLAISYRAGFAVLVGCITHILRDATGPPGVPLLLPVSLDEHVSVPRWTFLLVVFAFAATGAWLSARGARQSAAGRAYGVGSP